MRQFLSARAAASLGAAVLLGASAIVLAQPAQMTENPMVPAAAATHIAMLSGAQEVPPVTTAATGTAWIMLDEQTNTLTWTVEFTGLSGATAGAHFHGPAAVGTVGDVVLNLVVAGAAGETAGPIQGTGTITAEQAAQLTSGMWYVNIHTAAHPDGEIRGQVTAMGAEAALAPAVPGGGGAAGGDAGLFTPENVLPADPFGDLAVNPATINVTAIGPFLATLTPDGQLEIQQRCVVITANAARYDAAAVTLCTAVLVAAEPMPEAAPTPPTPPAPAP